jgi:hypothetical protein
MVAEGWDFGRAVVREGHVTPEFGPRALYERLVAEYRAIQEGVEVPSGVADLVAGVDAVSPRKRAARLLQMAGRVTTAQEVQDLGGAVLLLMAREDDPLLGVPVIRCLVARVIDPTRSDHLDTSVADLINQIGDAVLRGCAPFEGTGGDSDLEVGHWRRVHVGTGGYAVGRGTRLVKGPEETEAHLEQVAAIRCSDGKLVAAAAAGAPGFFAAHPPRGLEGPSLAGVG